MPKRERGTPTVLIADPLEETRMLLMQYVAIEWPDAEIVETGDLANEGVEGFDLVVAGVRPGCGVDTGWLQQVRARASGPSVVALVEGDPGAAQSLLQNGVYCQYRDSMTTDDMRRALRAALRERYAGVEMSDRTLMIDTGVLRGAQATHPIHSPPVARVQVRGFQLLKKLGQGGMSEVFLAQRERTSTVCALKVLRAEGASASVLNLFIEECGIVSRLDSPYVVRIYEHGVTDDYLFVAMEHIQGGDLRERIQLGLEPADACIILRQLAHALDAVHGAGLIHGDIKPQNVMFRDAHALVLVDFGVSRVMETNSAFLPGQIIGTPGYISPEHVLDAPIDGRSDLYSAGVLFYEMLTGGKPFVANDVDELLRMHVGEDPPPLPPALSGYQPIVDRLLAKRPVDRFASPAELIAHLDSISPANPRR
jgi:eukaryotic-like serine/threonine-protein kinase